MAENPQREAARAWFAKGTGDLRSAHALIALDPPETEAAAFHSQQAAEKYLKGFLAYHSTEPPRTHDLSALLDLAIDHQAELESLRASARFLVPYAVEVRYPFAGDPTTAEEAQEALTHARTLCNYIRRSTFPEDDTALSAEL